MNWTEKLKEKKYAENIISYCGGAIGWIAWGFLLLLLSLCTPKSLQRGAHNKYTIELVTFRTAYSSNNCRSKGCISGQKSGDREQLWWICTLISPPPLPNGVASRDDVHKNYSSLKVPLNASFDVVSEHQHLVSYNSS